MAKGDNDTDVYYVAHKTIHKKTVAKSAEDIVDNIL